MKLYLTTLATSTGAAFQVGRIMLQKYIKYKITNNIKNYEYKIHITKQMVQ